MLEQAGLRRRFYARFARKAATAAALALAFGLAAPAQEIGGPPPAGPPELPGAFKPVVGSGAQYELSTEKEKNMRCAYVVVGKEKVGGDEGYWLEMRFEVGEEGSMLMKQLIVAHGDKTTIKRMLFQAPGQPPMEMPVGVMAAVMKQDREGAAEKEPVLGKKLGTETVTVPAGTFLCQHYRAQSEKGTMDVWVSPKVSPYGMVKMVSQEMTMTLEKILTHQTSQMKGSPEKAHAPEE